MQLAQLVIRLGMCVALVSLVRDVHAEEPIYRRFKVSLGYHFSSGTYGTSDTTDMAYTPLVTKAEWDRWTVELTIPYIRVSGPATLVSGPVGPVQTTGGDQDGLGDIINSVSYTVPPRTDWMPFIGLIGRVKFPTASRSAGLGTGEVDAGFETELAWTIDRFAPFVSGGYRYLGSSEHIQLDNVWLSSVGGMYRLFDPLWAGLYLDYRQAASSSSGELLDVVPFGAWKLDPHWSVDTYVSAGLASGSPDVGVGLQLGYTL